jgi:hypothetical protein
VQPHIYGHGHSLLQPINHPSGLLTNSMQCRGFMLFLLTCLTLVWNFVAVLIAVIVVKFTKGAAAAWFFAALYVIVGVPGAWFTWCALWPTPASCHSHADSM